MLIDQLLIHLQLKSKIMVKTIAVIAVCVLVLLLLALRYLLKKFFKLISDEEQKKYKGLLPYPLLPPEGNSKAGYYAKLYHGIARVGLAAVVILALIPVLLSMVDYFTR